MDAEVALIRGASECANRMGVQVAKSLSILLVMVVFVNNFRFFEQSPIFLAAISLHLMLLLFVKAESRAMYYQSFSFIWLAAFITFLCIN